MNIRFVLVTEIDDTLVQIVRQEVATTHYALLCARDGQETLDYLDLFKSDIDIAIINIDLSVRSGLHVIWRTVGRKHSKPPRMIATTPVDDSPLLRHVVKTLGADTVVHVAVAGEDLRETIKMVLGGCSKGEESSVTAGV